MWNEIKLRIDTLDMNIKELCQCNLDMIGFCRNEAIWEMEQ